MPICGAKTKDGRQCRQRVSEAGQHCHLHSLTKPRAIWSRILKVCETITTIAGTAEGVHWVYQNAWPHIEPLWHSGFFCPESFWWDSLAFPVKKGKLPAEIHSKLEVALDQMREDEKQIEDKLARYSESNMEHLADAYAKVFSEIRTHYPHLANALPPKATRRVVGTERG